MQIRKNEYLVRQIEIDIGIIKCLDQKIYQFDLIFLERQNLEKSIYIYT